MKRLNPDWSEAEPNDDEAVWAWYGNSRASGVVTCPECFGAVAAVVDAARGHMDWHRGS